MSTRRSIGGSLRSIGYVLAGRNVRQRTQRSRSRVRIDRAVMELLELRQLMSVVTVTTCADSGAGSLRDAIAIASAGDVINFDSHLAGQTITLTSGALDLATDLTIDGLGASTLTISGDSNSSVFTVEAGVTASITGLTITGGQADQGAGVFNAGVLTLDHDTLTGNGSTATSQGGAVYNANVLTITNSTISGNAAQQGGGVYSYNGPMNISDSTLTGNTAVQYGGAIFNSAVAYLTNDAVTSNRAGSGGGIQNTGGITITGGSMSNNAATDAGGAGGAINGAGTLNADGVAFSGNTAATGGAIDSTGVTTIQGGTFSGDSATNGTGGGIYSDGNLKVYGVNFSGESATDGGGAVANYGRATITGSTLNGNSAGGQGGGGIFSTGALNVDTTTFSNDQATGASNGGGIENLGVLSAINSTFSGDTAANGNGGAIYNYGSNGNYAYAYLQNTAITGCSAQAGGGVFNKSTIILQKGSVTGDTATAGNGGGIDNLATLKADGVLFSNDQALNGNGGGIANTGDGSAAGLASLLNCTVSNSSAVNGGAIYNQNDVLTIQSSTLFGDSATNNGGCVDNLSTLFAANATFTENSAGNQGGAIYNNSAAKLVNCTIVANSAGGGGGIATSGAGSDATLNNTIISQNTSGASASDILGSLNFASSHNLVGTAGGNGATGGLLQGVNGNIVNVANPMLSMLRNNGGPDFTMAPLPGSAAIDAGDTALALDSNGNPLMFDQRGLSGTSAQGGTPRVVGSSVDIGAVEVGGYTLAPAPGSNPQNAPVNTSFANALTVEITAVNGLDPVDGGVISFSILPGANGQSALLAALTANVTSGAQAVTATANNQAGIYFVNATVAGAVNSAQFQLKNLAAPAISTTPGGTVVVGSGSHLTDTATITGGSAPTGTLVFTLYSPTNAVVDTETVTVNGNGTYSTPSGYVPTGTDGIGTYQWGVVYNGDSNNVSAISPVGSEPEAVAKASPTITTTASETAGGVVGSAMLSDSVTVAGGDSPSGTITFLLTAPDGTTITTETLSFTGDGTYSAPTPVLASQVGTYVWSASYTGNTLNNGATDQGGVAETNTTVKASPTITTTASETASGVVGSTMLSDSVTVAGGDSPSGTITFLLTAPDGTTITTETLSFSGDGTYSAPTPVLANQVGTYVWSASYAGNTLNNGATDQGGAAETNTTVKASPAITTTPGGTVILGSGSKLSDSATISGGFNESGSLVFTLYGPNNTVVDTETVTVNGNGTYGTPSGYVPTTAAGTGTYQWAVTYNGDNSNSVAISPVGSEPESVTVGAASRLVYTQQPTNAMAGTMIAPAVTVTIEDQYGNVLTSDNSSLTIAVNSGPSTVLNGTLTVNAVNGVATYSNLSLNTAGVYTLFASDSTDMVNAVSNNFTISAAAAQQLVFVQQPTGTYTNTVISPAVTVAVEDQFGNLETGDNSNVTLAINSGPAGATLAGTLTVSANGGIATFSNLSLNAAGTYTLAAGDAALAHAISGSFNITAVVSSQGGLSGTVYKDITGNGLTADDTVLSGVVVKVYKDLNGNGVLDSSDGAPVATMTTGADGTYSFTNLAPGKYIIAETVPTGDVETAPNLPDYYPVTVAANVNLGNLNFDNFQTPNCPLQNVYYTINGSCTKLTNLRGATAQGETVTVTFTVPTTSAPMVYSLVTYNAPDSVFNASDASQQTIYQDATGTFGPGTHSLTVTIPNNYYQIDFVCGAAIDKLGPAGSNIFYSAENRLDSADNAGLHSDVDDESATMAFWASLGQSLIKSFGGSSTSTALGNWLSSTMPNVFGGTALGNKTNATVASTYMSYYNVSGQKNVAQVMATALNVYASTLSLGGSAGTPFGFNVTAAGLGAADFNIGNNGAAFGVANNTTITVSQMLSYVNSKSSKNVLYNGVTTLLNQAYNELGQVNGDGGLD